MTKTSDVKKNRAKAAAQKRAQTWKPGQSGNPKGGPKRGQSWKEIVKEVSDLTPEQADEYCHVIASKIKSIGDGVTLKQAVILRVFTALLFEPDARLLGLIMDRDEGKVTQPVTEMPWREYVIQMGYDPELVMREAENIVRSRFAELGDTGGDSGSDREPAQRAREMAE